MRRADDLEGAAVGEHPMHENLFLLSYWAINYCTVHTLFILRGSYILIQHGSYPHALLFFHILQHNFDAVEPSTRHTLAHDNLLYA